MELEKLVIENAKNIAMNTANISVMMKIMYLLIGGVVAQVTLSIKGIVKNGGNKK